MNHTDTISFARPYEELESRLDYLYYHPILNELSHLAELTPFKIELLGALLLNNEGITKGGTPPGILYLDYGIPFIGAGNVRAGFLDLSNVTFIDESYQNGELSGSRLAYDDVLVTMAGTIGRCAVYDVHTPAAINQAVARLRILPKVLPAYLVRYLNSRWGQLGFLKYSQHVGQPNISFQEMQRIQVVLPLVAKQQQILAIVLPIEEGASQLSARVARARSSAVALLPELLDLPADAAPTYFKTGQELPSRTLVVFAGDLADRLHYHFYHPRPAALLAALQARYPTTTLADPQAITYLRRGEQPTYTEEGEVMVLKTVDLKNGYIAYDDALRVSQEFFEATPQAQLQKGDILLASTGHGSMGKVDVYDRDEPALADGHLTILRPSVLYDPYFVAYYLRSEIGQLQIEKWFTGSSGQIELQPEDIRKFLIPTVDEAGVPLAEQQRIAARITKRLNWARALEAAAARRWAQARTAFEDSLLKPAS